MNNLGIKVFGLACMGFGSTVMIAGFVSGNVGMVLVGAVMGAVGTYFFVT